MALYSLTQSEMSLALGFILLGAIADVFDGPLARKTLNRPPLFSEFGQGLDTLGDMCHSVLAPALFVTLAQGGSLAGILCGLILAAAGTTRLAYFTAVGSDKPGFFVGVPVTYLPLTLGIVANLFPAQQSASVVYILYSLIMVALQTGKFYFPKFSHKGLYLFALILILLATLSFSRALFPATF
ncbi:phosphatidylserine synthase [Erwinia rhapontici]|nr:phosphatidylserine synthase [Erwinia rhapontici]